MEITIRHHTAGEWQELTIDVRFTKQTCGGWHVVRADNGRYLGWIVRGEDNEAQWVARVTSSAFHGTGPDDEGDVLDRVPAHLSREYAPMMHSPIGGGRTRLDAAEDILYWLVKTRAPAVGFGPHSKVEPWQPR